MMRGAHDKSSQSDNRTRRFPRGSLCTAALALAFASCLISRPAPAEAPRIEPAVLQDLLKGPFALPAGTQPIPATGTAQPTAAWTEFCRRLPRECAVDTRERSVIELTREVWATLVRVNLEVNTTIRPLTDRAHWNVEDRWDFPDDGMGDCEDYQLLKRRKLVEAGLPRRALLMTVVIDDEKAGHAVLMVRTDRGDFILDNKRDAILPWNDTGYAFVKREGQDSLAWASLEPLPSPIVTANR